MDEEPPPDQRRFSVYYEKHNWKIAKFPEELTSPLLRMLFVNGPSIVATNGNIYNMVEYDEHAKLEDRGGEFRRLDFVVEKVRN